MLHKRLLPVLLLLLAAIAIALMVPWAGAPDGGAAGQKATAGKGAAAATAAADATKAATATEPAAPDRTDRTPVDTGKPPVCTVRGRVLGVRGVPVTGAVVVARQGRPGDRRGDATMMGMLGNGMRDAEDAPMLQRGEVIARATVTADGTFELPAPSRHLRLGLEHDLYGLASPCIVHVPENAAQAHAVLAPYLGACVRGRLLGAPTALADVATVRLTLEVDQLAAMRNPSSITAVIGQMVREPVKPAADGAFLFRAVVADHNATITAEGKVACGRTLAPSLQPGETREVALPVETGGTVAATVVDAGGKPVAAASVSIEGLDGGQMARTTVRQHETTDAAGQALLQGLLPGRFRVRAEAQGWAAAEHQAEVRSGGRAEIRLQLGAGRAVDGIVVDAAGTPVADAKVASFPAIQVPLMGDMSEQFGLDFMTTATRNHAVRSDAQGRFHLGGIDEEGKFHVVAAADGYAGGVTKDVTAPASDVRVVLQKAATVTGRVVAAEDQQPLAAFQLELQVSMFLGIKRPTRSETVTDPDGRFRVEASPGALTLAVRADERSEVKKDIKLDAGTALDVGELQLPRGCRIRGVVQGEDGTPLRGALVRQKQGGMLDNAAFGAFFGGGNVNDRTDDQGRFELIDLPPGRPILLASADGWATGRSDRLPLVAGQTLDGVVITLGHGGAIHGRVRAAPGERPEEFAISVKELQTQNTRMESPGPDGSFAVSDLDPGQYEVQAMHPSALAAMQRSQTEWRPGQAMKIGDMMRAITDATVGERCVVRAGETTEVTIDASQLDAGTRLHLRVLVGDKPLDNGVVEATAVADGQQRIGFVQDGSTTLGGLRPGQLRLQVRGGVTLLPLGEPQDLVIGKDDGQRQEVLRLPGGELRGRVVDARSGNPLPYVLVRLQHGDAARHNDLIGAAITDAQGGFAFTGLQDGDYGLVAADESDARGGEGAASRLGGLRVQGGHGPGGIELRAQPAAGVTAVVTDAAGAPIGGALLLCVDPDGRPVGLGTAVAGTDGKAHFGGLPRGPLRVIGRAPGLAPGASEVQEAQPGQLVEFPLRLQPGTRVQLQCKGKDGRDLADAEITASCDGGPWFPAELLVVQRSAGTFELGRLGPGTWSFRIASRAAGTFTVRRSIGGTGTVTIVALPE